MSGDANLDHSRQINDDFKNKSGNAWNEYVAAVTESNGNVGTLTANKTITEDLVGQGRLPDMLVQAEQNHIFKDASGNVIENLTMCNLQDLAHSTDPIAKELALAMIARFKELDAADGNSDGNINLTNYQARHMNATYAGSTERFADSSGAVTETISDDGRLTTFADNSSVEHIGSRVIYRDPNNKPTDVYEGGVLVNHYVYNEGNGNLIQYMDHGVVYKKYSDDTFGDHRWWPFQPGPTYPSNSQDLIDLKGDALDDVQINPDTLAVTIIQNGYSIATESPGIINLPAAVQTANFDQQGAPVDLTVQIPINGRLDTRGSAHYIKNDDGTWTVQVTDKVACHQPVPVMAFKDSSNNLEFFDPSTGTITTIRSDASITIERVTDGERTVVHADGSSSAFTFRDGHLVEALNSQSKIDMHFDQTGHLASADLADGSHLVFNATTGGYDHMTADGVFVGTVQGDLSGATGELQFKAAGATNFVNLNNGESWKISTEKGAYTYRGDGSVSEIDLGMQKIYYGTDGKPTAMDLEKPDGTVQSFVFGANGWQVKQADPTADIPGSDRLNQSKTLIDLDKGTVTISYPDHTDVYSAHDFSTATSKGTDSVTSDGTAYTTTTNNKPGDTNPIFSLHSDDNLAFDIELPPRAGQTDQVGWIKASSGIWTFHDASTAIVGPKDVTLEPYVNRNANDPKNGDVTFTLKDGSTVEYDRHGHIVETVSGSIKRDFQYSDGYLSRVTPPGEMLKVRMPAADPPVYDVLDINDKPTGIAFAITLTPDGVLSQSNIADNSSGIYRPNGEIEKHRADGSWELFHADGMHEFHTNGLVINYDAANKLLNYAFDASYVVPDSVKNAHSTPIAFGDETAMLDFLNSDSGVRLSGMISDKDGYIAFAAVDEAFKLIGKTPPGFSDDEVKYLTSMHDSFFALTQENPLDANSEKYSILSINKEERQLAAEGWAKVKPGVAGSDVGMALSFIRENPLAILNTDQNAITKDQIDSLYSHLSDPKYSAVERTMITTLHDSFMRLSPDGSPITLDKLAQDAGYSDWTGLVKNYTTVGVQELFDSNHQKVSQLVTTIIANDKYALEVDYVNPPGDKLVVGYKGTGTEINQIAEPNGTVLTDITSLGNGQYSFTVTGADGSKHIERAKIDIDTTLGTVKFDYGNGHIELINADGSRSVCDGTGQPTRTLTLDAGNHEHVTKVDNGNGKTTEYSYNAAGDLLQVKLPNGLALERPNGHEDFSLTPLGIKLKDEQIQLSAEGVLSVASGKTSTPLVATNGDVSAIPTPLGLATHNADGTTQIDNPQSHYSKIVFDALGHVIELDSPPHATKFTYAPIDSSNPTATVTTSVTIDGQPISAAGDTIAVNKDGSFSIQHGNDLLEKFNADGTTEEDSAVNHTNVYKDAYGNITKTVNIDDSANPVTREFSYATPAGPNAPVTKIVQGATEWEPDPSNPNVWLRYGTVNHERILDASDTQQSLNGPVKVSNEWPDAGKITFGDPLTPPFAYWNADGKTELHNADKSVTQGNAFGQITKLTLADGTYREFTYSPANNPHGVIVQFRDTDGSIWKFVPTESDPSLWLHLQSADPTAGPGNPADGHFSVSFADKQGTLRIQHTSTYGTMDVFTTDGKVNGKDAPNIVDAPAPVVVAPVVADQPAAPVVIPTYTQSADCLAAESAENYLSSLKPWQYDALKNGNGQITLESLNAFIQNHSTAAANDNPAMLQSAQYLRDHFSDINQAAQKDSNNYLLLSDMQTYVNKLNDASIDASPDLTSAQKLQLKQLTDGMSVYQVKSGDVPIEIGMTSLKAQGFEHPTSRQALLEAKRIMRLNGWDETSDPSGSTWVNLYVGQKLVMQQPEVIEHVKQSILAGGKVDLKQLARDAGIVSGDQDQLTGDPAHLPPSDQATWTNDTTLPNGITRQYNSSYPYNDETTFADGSSIVKNIGTGKFEAFSPDGKRIGIVDDAFASGGQFKPTVGTDGSLSYNYKDSTNAEIDVTVRNGVTSKVWEGAQEKRRETDYSNGLVVKVGTDGLQRVCLPTGDVITQRADLCYYYTPKGTGTLIKIQGYPQIDTNGGVAIKYARNSQETVTVTCDRNGVEQIVHVGGSDGGLIETKYPNGEVWKKNGDVQTIDLPNGEKIKKTVAGWQLLDRNSRPIAAITGEPTPDLIDGSFTFTIAGDSHLFTVSATGAISCKMSGADVGRNAAIERLKLLGAASPTERQISQSSAALGITALDHPYPDNTDVVLIAPAQNAA